MEHRTPTALAKHSQHQNQHLISGEKQRKNNFKKIVVLNKSSQVLKNMSRDALIFMILEIMSALSISKAPNRATLEFCISPENLPALTATEPDALQAEPQMAGCGSKVRCHGAVFKSASD